MRRLAWGLTLVPLIAAVAATGLLVAHDKVDASWEAPTRSTASGVGPPPVKVMPAQAQSTRRVPEVPAAEAAPARASSEPPEPPTPEQRIFELEQRFESDGLPDARAHQIGRDVRIELERALEGSGSLEAVDCKLKTCRALLSLPDMNADRAMFQRILAAGEGPFASFAMRAERHIRADGKVETTLFFFL